MTNGQFSINTFFIKSSCQSNKSNDHMWDPFHFFIIGRRQAIIWTNAGISLIGPLGTNFIEILIEIYTFSFKKMHLKMSSGECRPFCLGLNVLKSTARQQTFCGKREIKATPEIVMVIISHIASRYRVNTTL